MIQGSSSELVFIKLVKYLKFAFIIATIPTLLVISRLMQIDQIRNEYFAKEANELLHFWSNSNNFRSIFWTQWVFLRMPFGKINFQIQKIELNFFCRERRKIKKSIFFFTGQITQHLPESNRIFPGKTRTFGQINIFSCLVKLPWLVKN